jgi:hypothetical protein
MFDFTGKKKADPEVSPGGSVIHRYPGHSWLRGKTGVPNEAAAQFAEARHAAYEKVLCPVDQTFVEPGAAIPRVDVRSYRRKVRGTDFCTLVTSGMSDLPMPIPRKLEGAAKRVELIFYCPEIQLEYVETMRFVAHFPHDQRTWIGPGHTIPNGNPPAPFFGSSILDTILLIQPIIKPDNNLKQELVIEGDAVEFLWVVPLSSAECRLKLAEGVNAVLELFEKHRHPPIFDPNRPSYV